MELTSEFDEFIGSLIVLSSLKSELSRLNRLNATDGADA